MLNAYSARKTFTGSSRKARYAGTRLAIKANKGKRGRDGSKCQRV